MCCSDIDLSAKTITIQRASVKEGRPNDWTGKRTLPLDDALAGALRSSGSAGT